MPKYTLKLKIFVVLTNMFILHSFLFHNVLNISTFLFHNYNKILFFSFKYYFLVFANFLSLQGYIGQKFTDKQHVVW